MAHEHRVKAVPGSASLLIICFLINSCFLISLLAVCYQLFFGCSVLLSVNIPLDTLKGGVATFSPECVRCLALQSQLRYVRRITILFHTYNSFNGNFDGYISDPIYWSSLLDESCNSLSRASQNEGLTAAWNKEQRC